jgi:hypothetical protein
MIAGYGCVDADDAVACASDRATFFATGTLQRDCTTTIAVPVPVAIGGQSAAAYARRYASLVHAGVTRPEELSKLQAEDP